MKKTSHSPSTCVAFATNVLGDKWTPRLLFALGEKNLGFCELQSQAGGVNPRTLTQRLVALEEMKILLKTEAGYELTPKGHDLLPILRQMAAWGGKYPT